MKLKKTNKVEDNIENIVDDKEVKPKYSNLKEIMDYSRPLSIFYSGVEQESYLDILYDLGIRNFLMSYEYLKGKGSGQLKKYPDMHLFIDSGAYTYQNDPKYEEYTEEQWENVAEEFEALVKQAEKYEDLTAEEKLDLAAVQAKYAGIQAKKGINKVIDGVKDLFGGKKNK